jgi:uncharacterized protein (TIGR00369 family)
MTNHISPDPDFDSRIRASFGRQGLMKTIGARLAKVAPGEVRIEIPFGEGLTQQHGFVHAGIVTAIVDNACGFAANTLMPPDCEVLTVEYKVNFLSPATGETFVAIGKAVKPGTTLTVCTGEVWAHAKGDRKLIAVMQATMMAVKR